MLRFFLSLICLAVLAFPCQAQPYVHIFLERSQDKENAEFSKCVQADTDNMRMLLENNISESDLVFVTGGFPLWPSEPSARRILNGIEACQIDKNDVLFFYISAHGESGEDGQYINLRTPVGNDDDRLSRKALVEALKKKRARLTILITDCCNTYKAGTKNAERKEAVYPKMRPQRRGTAIHQANVTVYRFKKLFFESRGFVDISSCSKEQKSYTDAVEIGSIFTLALCKTLEENREARQNVTWEQIGAVARKKTEERFRANFKNSDDYPRWKGAGGEIVVQEKQTPVFVVTRP